jgi:hypothetical protein
VKLPAIASITTHIDSAKPYSFKQGARKIKLASSLPAIFATDKDHDDEFSSFVTEDWLNTYESERSSFQSASVFCEVKLREIVEVRERCGSIQLAQLKDVPAYEPVCLQVTQFLGQPNKVRTAVCMDLLDTMIGTLQGAALQRLLSRLRDELMHAIYAPAPTSGSGPGSSPDPGAGTASPFLDGRGRKGLPTVLDLIRRSEWFSLLHLRRERNATAQHETDAMMRPLREARARMRPVRVVEAMIRKWKKHVKRMVVLTWALEVRARRLKFEQNRVSTMTGAGGPGAGAGMGIEAEIGPDGRPLPPRETPKGKHVRIVTRLINRTSNLITRLSWIVWRVNVLETRHKQLLLLHEKLGLQVEKNVADQKQSLGRADSLNKEVETVAGELLQVQSQLRMLRYKKEESEADLANSAKHQETCAEILRLLRDPLRQALQAVDQQVTAVSTQHFQSLGALLTEPGAGTGAGAGAEAAIDSDLGSVETKQDSAASSAAGALDSKTADGKESKAKAAVRKLTTQCQFVSPFRRAVC